MRLALFLLQCHRDACAKKAFLCNFFGFFRRTALIVMVTSPSFHLHTHTRACDTVQLFDYMAAQAPVFGIDDYSVSQATLEQVFISLAKEQEYVDPGE